MEVNNNNYEILNEEAISPYDVSYPATLLSNSIRTRLEMAQDSVSRIYRAVIRSLPEAAQIEQAFQKGCRYVVDMSDDMVKAVEDGTVKLTQENGKTYAQLKNNGHYGKKLPIKKEVFGKGIDPAQMAGTLQMQALQDQLQAVTERLNLIGDYVEEILQGQQNDRIGLYYSGVSLFLESEYVLDDHLKKSLQAQALRALADASFQLRLNMKDDIQFLAQRKYEKIRGKREATIMQHMGSINQTFAFIHQAMMLRAAIYCNIGESAAMGRVLNEYTQFIEQDLKPNSELLSLYDLKDDGSKNGLWTSRMTMNLDTSELTKALCEPPNVLYLGIETGE